MKNNKKLKKVRSKYDCKLKTNKIKSEHEAKKEIAPSEDRTHDLQIALSGFQYSDYETDALPTALLRLYTLLD